MKIANKIFGEKFKRFMGEASIKQDYLAEKLGVEVETVSRWANGKFSPDDEKFEQICKVLNREPGEFFGQDARPDLRFLADVLYKMSNLEPTHLRAILTLVDRPALLDAVKVP